MKIYNPTTKLELDEVRNFMTRIIENEFGYKVNKIWHEDILNLKRVYTKDRSILLVMKEKSKIIGTIAGREYDRSYSKFKKKYSSKNTLGIWRHYVDKDYRSKGLGTKLLIKLIEFAKLKRYKFLYLHTQKTIPNSLEYWISKGFNITWDTHDDFETVHLEKVIK